MLQAKLKSSGHQSDMMNPENWTDLRKENPKHWDMANAIRFLAADAVQKAKSGHPGMPMGMADVATVLFSKHLKFDANNHQWPDRDRFVLSAGHGSMLLYALLYLTGYKDVTLDDIKNFRQLGAKTAGHPEYGHMNGIETTTGPLGQGLATAVGMAVAEKLQAERLGKKIVDHYTYVIAGDGCLMEGISQEALSLAGHLELGKLIVLFDDNGISIDGELSLTDSTDQLARFQASGWDVQSIDGHNPTEIDAAIQKAKDSKKPSLIACKTVIGYGAPTKGGSSSTHGSPLGDSEITAARKWLDWPHAAFEIPKNILNDWRDVGQRGHGDFEAWNVRMIGLSERKRADYDRVMEKELPKRLSAAVKNLKQSISEKKPSVATRKASEDVLEVLNPLLPEMIGGSADLTGSNNTKTSDLAPISADSFKGRYIYYGIREHAMAAIMNGLALHGGFLPYGGTFLVFSDYARGAIRLSALMEQRVVYVMTHDSIGLGEDGPTHQPVEHLAMLRATPNLNVFRPCDAVETAEAWEVAVSQKNTPSVLALSRQNLPTLRTTHTLKNLTAQGAYVLADSEGRRQVILMATGSEVEIAMQAREALQKQGIGTRVVSVPCMDLFEQQDESYQRKVLPRGPVRVAIEAAVRMGWDRWLAEGKKFDFVGMKGFGASAPAKDLYEHFNITPEAVVETVKKLL
jgi:transketolase